MTEIETIKIVFGVLLSVGAIVLCLLAYLLYYKYLIQEKRCTMKTTGIVKKYSFATRGGENSGVRLPVVHYVVHDKEYKVMGPQYKYYKYVTVSTPLGSNAIEYHETDNQGLIIKQSTNAMISKMKNPMSELYPVGSQVDIYYNPDNPKLAYVLRYLNLKSRFWFMFVTGIMVMVFNISLQLFL